MSDRRAIVTGGAGFIGSHVVDALLADDWRVVVVDDLSTGDARRVAEGATLEALDITDREALDEVIDSAEPTAIFHLAAQASVTRSVADPGRDCEVNVTGTLNVLEGATRHGAPIVFTSTGGALYGDRAPLPTAEDWFPAPISPYGASKWAAEAYVTTWREAHGIDHAVARLANVYGPRQNPHGEAGVVAIFSNSLWRGAAPTLFGFGKPTRDYVHVHDVARALLAALGHGGVFNISTGVETPVSRLYELLRAAAGSNVEGELAPLREGELERSCIDPSRAREQLDWQAEIGLEEGLAATYRAMVEDFERDDARATG
ncbi:MAG TPA: NAD-dependent epimerase/dehydratase family protein [Gaiellaceae bacterium]|jgi:UDP-glucose 4-epimerase|nr:NAD-dependent epimerase/dehydratase family protein [Gaiellaceae bacterium]